MFWSVRGAGSSFVKGAEPEKRQGRCAVGEMPRRHHHPVGASGTWSVPAVPGCASYVARSRARPQSLGTPVFPLRRGKGGADG